MAFMLVFGFIAIIFTIAYRAVQMGEESTVAPTASSEPRIAPEQAFSGLDVDVAPRTSVGQIELDGDRMAVHTSGPGGQEIIIIDLRTGELLGRVKLVETPDAGQ